METTTGNIPCDEITVRRHLSIACRLFAYFGWTDLGATHLSARLQGSLKDGFLINPRNLWLGEMREHLLYHSNAGDENNPSEHASSDAGIGIPIHQAIYKARKDINCILHTHTIAGIAVSMQTTGLQMLSNHAAMFFGRVGYHQTCLEEEECAAIAGNLADYNAMILRNHGLLVCGRNIPEAFVRIHLLERACKEQLAGQMTGVPLLQVQEEVCIAISNQADELISSHANAMWSALSRLVEQSLNGVYETMEHSQNSEV